MILCAGTVYGGSQPKKMKNGGFQAAFFLKFCAISNILFIEQETELCH